MAKAKSNVAPADVTGVGAERLRSFIERVERLEEEKAALTADIREVYAEAKGEGFDTKVMRQLVRLRKMDSGDRQEQEAILDLYKQALGMLADTELGRSALERAERELTGGSRKQEAGGEGRSTEAANGDLKTAVAEKLTQAGFNHKGGNTWSPPAGSP